MARKATTPREEASAGPAGPRTEREQEELAERLRLSEEARRIARVAASSTSLDEVVEQTAADIVRLFGLAALRVQVIGDHGVPAARRTYPGPPGDGDPRLDEIAGETATRLWQAQRIGVVEAEGADEEDGPRVAEIQALLRERGYGSVALVPLGAGAEVLGWLALMRAPGAPAWTAFEAALAFEIGLDTGRVLADARALVRERRLVGELQAVDAYKNRLIGTVSHELRNPLAAIRSNLELLAEANLDPAARRALDVAQRSAGRMARVVDNLLDLARSLDERAPADAAPIDLGSVVYDAADLLAEEARQRGVPLIVEVPESPAHVLGDLDLLGQVALNLLSNAIKYTPAGRPVRVGVQVDGGEAELSVSDRGIGISEADQRHLFTEFFRSSDPAVHAEPGTGLGLAIVDRLVRRHGGRIEVESELGAGTTVSVRLPLAQMP